ncbi:NAD(P)-dependent oxidoreductase [Mycolicibacterium sp.]|uniref:NAD(P)-dependent oxidoreductase n=1 Tax=Mycolicibacterium sp. TaxID=2320850 RepID=UPI001A3363CA|nr:NAD(P)-dependent oxidoreductase [Mycolicibacterium sp.]MBJ7336790.1 NAD(P)-dependent oxidoreductase [Mycolicibacterium sp.]
MTEVIGFIGAGRLGEPMVLRLLDAGHQVLVHARSGEVRDRLWIHGAALADSVAVVAAESDIVISCLSSDAQLSEISQGLDGVPANAKHDALFVSHTNGAVQALAEMAARSTKGLQVLDAPVSGTAEDVAEGAVTVLLGGASDAVERVKPVLAAYAKPIIPTGGLGSALHLKLINNLLFAANAQLVVAASEFGRALGVDPTALLSALMVCSGGSAAAAQALVAGGVDAFASVAGPNLRRDVAACLDAAELAGADSGALGALVRTGPLRLTPGRP